MIICGEKLGKLNLCKENSKTNPRNQKLQNLDQDSRINHQVNEIEISKIENRKKIKIEIKIDSNYDSKFKSKAIRRKIRMKIDF